MTLVYGRTRKLSDAEIVAAYVGGRDSDTVSYMAGCSGTTVIALVRAAGGTVRSPGGVRRTAELDISNEEIIRRYLAGESGCAIATAAGTYPATIYRILRNHEVAVRPSRNQRRRVWNW